VENLFDKKYYIKANSNTNILPRLSGTLRVVLTSTLQARDALIER
jgi:hypothetical protein